MKRVLHEGFAIIRYVPRMSGISRKDVLLTNGMFHDPAFAAAETVKVFKTKVEAEFVLANKLLEVAEDQRLNNVLGLNSIVESDIRIEPYKKYHYEC